MKRRLAEELKKWQHSKNRKPLIIEGARQVGKTFLINEFGKENFSDVLRVDFSKPNNPLKDLFEGSIEPKRIIENLSAYFNLKIDPEKTLIFFDEIQDCPRALTSLKYFYEEASEYHVIAAGSLLGVFLSSENHSSFPVGKVDISRLYPLDFEEFLIANDCEKLIAAVREEPEATFLDEKLKDLFNEYLVTGGMPEVVATWLETRDIERVKHIQKNILAGYEQDFSKYSDPKTAVRIRQVYYALPKQFAKDTERFLYGTVREGARAKDYELAIEWLIGSGLIHRVERVSRGDKLPLKAYIEPDNFKLYFLDIGLFGRLAEIEPQDILYHNNLFSEFNGLFAEQFVLQQLVDHSLFYWTGATSEVDFVFQDGSDIVPIEVKSGENVKSKSLHVFREKYNSPRAIRFSLLPYKKDDGLANVPLYKIFVF